MSTNTQQEDANGYDCERCGHHTTLKGNLIQHLKKKNSCRASNSTKSRQDIINEMTRVSEKEKVHKCNYCVKMFSTVAGKSQHKKVCPSRPEMALQNQVNLLQEQVDTLSTQSGVEKTIYTTPLVVEQDLIFQDVSPQQVQTVSRVDAELPAVVQTMYIDIRLLKEQLRQELMIEIRNEIITKECKDDVATTSTTAPTKAVQQKHKIPHSIRCKAWDTHIGAEIGKAECFCCKKNTIWQYKFTCGHIVSRADGGTLAMDNLRPICDTCNNDMGNENMREFALRIYNVEII